MVRLTSYYKKLRLSEVFEIMIHYTGIYNMHIILRGKSNHDINLVVTC